VNSSIAVGSERSEIRKEFEDYEEEKELDALPTWEAKDLLAGATDDLLR